MTGFEDMTAAELRDERLDSYRAVDFYARAYAQAVDAEDAVWARGMRNELDAASARALRLERLLKSGIAA